MRKMAAWLSLVMLVGALSACSSGNSKEQGGTASTAPASESPKAASASPSAPAAPVKLVVSIPAGELSKELVAEFEASHPNIKIEQVTLDATKLSAQLATGEAPDVIRITGVYELPQWVNRGVALDLTPFFNASKAIDQADLLPIANVYRYDGKKVGAGPIYGLPKDWSNDFALFYNKRVFDAAGVPLPDPTKPLTWPEVIELAKKLVKKDGNTITQYGLAATDWAKSEPHYALLLQYLLSAGQTINTADNSAVNFDQPAVRNFLTMWIDAVKSNVGPNSLNNDQTKGGDLFMQDKMGLVVNGYWYSGSLRGGEKSKTHLSDFGMLPTPIAPGGQRVAPTSAATGAIINKATKHPQEAWTFFEWYFAGKPADERAKGGWGLPIFKSKMALLPQTTDFDKQVFAVMNEEYKRADKFLDVNAYLSSGGWATFDKYAVPLYFGKSSIDEAVAGMTKDANVTIKETMNAK